MIAQEPGIGFSITVPELGEALIAIPAHGGTVTSEPQLIGPDAGWFARFRDPNGNCLEVYSDRLE